MSTLYRQYRPQIFAEVFGQNHVKITLSEEIKRQQIASAYLFCGPRAVGKTTIARLLAKSLNCLNRPADSAEPCNQCANCLAIAAGQSLDIIEVDAASQTGVDNVRENIIASSRLASNGGQYKVFIIDEVHMLSNSSFNALLKTLEEPPKQVVFILCTTEVHKIPATVISRCERFDFKKIGPSDMAKKLQYILKQEGWSADDAVLTAIFKNSQGHLRDAESLLGQLLAISQPIKGSENNLTMEDFYLLAPNSDMTLLSQFLKSLAEQNAVEAINLVNQLVADGRDVRVFLQDLIEILRQLLLSKINPQLLPDYQAQWGEDDAFGLLDLRQRFSANRLVQLLQIFLQAFNESKEAFISQLPVELAIVKALQPTEQPPVSRPNQSATPVKTVPEITVTKTEPIKIVDDSKQSPLLIDDLPGRWSIVLDKIKSRNAGLSVMLKACQPQLDGQQVCLLFRYKFHQDQVKQPKIKHLLEEVLAEVCQQPVAITTKLLADLDIKLESSQPNEANDFSEQPADSSINNLLEIFNGQIVSEA
ncbi:DNA polymerase III subunit gamma/tau [Candidatus Falkowbacteria bacterium]|nr:DNA polymerase III subunit gamma/tau [Candidatus Falkowbacteria bacterium]